LIHRISPLDRVRHSEKWLFSSGVEQAHRVRARMAGVDTGNHSPDSGSPGCVRDSGKRLRNSRVRN